MIILFWLILFSSIWNLSIEIVISEGMALYCLRKWAQRKNSKWHEPLILCVWCRPSIHVLVGYVVAFCLGIISNFEWSLLVLYPFVVGATSLISGIVWSVYKLIEIKTKYYSHLEQHAYFDLKNRKQNHFINMNK